ncbi:hypothetical protein M0R89_19305 (plasmid) [Halorussus limi]|uniref:Uncharacterized protein n=1 Tax=Halorussus limi TaxID=2938695 RepID=A0A8U0HYS5_9EURY|nr:hypothetical protein [Halorussus limi]UPV76312.1 hypothetical protein M0R89_19305 [Halorussus limi]
MGVSTSLRRLAEFAERLEESEPEITELQSRNEATNHGLEADVSVELPIQADADDIAELSVTNAALTDEGAISIRVAAAFDCADEGASDIEALPSTVGVASPTAVEDGPESDIEDASPTDAEEASLTAVTADTDETANGVTDGGTAIVSTPDSDETELRERPPYKDPERLAEVYDSESTFPEMRDELGVDVTPKTVRHYMVEYGIHDPETLPPSHDDDGSKPTYKDPERLAEVYDSERTFPEMRDELGVDVTPKTVRHYMVKYGIHDPETDSSGAPTADSSDETGPELAAEGTDGDSTPDGDTISDDSVPDSGDVAAEIAESVELPDDLSVVGVTEAVCTAKTLYEVQRELGIDREQTYRLLSELNLLELVHGRVSTVSAHSQSRKTVERRIREAVTNANRSD